MPYMQKTTCTSDKSILAIEKYYSWSVRPSGKQRAKRAQKQNLSTERQQRINYRNAVDKAAMLMANNFTEGDFYLTVTYDEDHRPAKEETLERVNKDIRNFLDKLKRRYKKRGVEFKSVCIPENISGAGKGRPHFHVLIPQLPGLEHRRKVFSELWGKGNVKVDEYGGTLTDARRLSGYFLKQDKKERGARLRTSQNLKRPKEEKKTITRANCYSFDFTIPEGYALNKEFSRQDYTEDGYPCQRLFFERVTGGTQDKRRYTFDADGFIKEAARGRKRKTRGGVNPSLLRC